MSLRADARSSRYKRRITSKGKPSASGQDGVPALAGQGRIHLSDARAAHKDAYGGKLQRSNGKTFRRPYISVRELALAGTVVLIIWRPPGLLGRTGMTTLVRRKVAPPTLFSSSCQFAS